MHGAAVFLSGFLIREYSSSTCACIYYFYSLDDEVYHKSVIVPTTMPRKRKQSDLSERCRFCLARQDAAFATQLFADGIKPKLEDLERCANVQVRCIENVKAGQLPPEFWAHANFKGGE